MDERRGEVEPAPHPARVGADPPVGGLSEPDPLEQRVAAALASAPTRPCSVACSADQLAAGHQRVERRLLQRDPDRAAHLGRLVDDVVAGDRRPAAGRTQQRGQHPHGGRLAGAVGAEEGVDLALGDLEVDAVDGA